MFPACGPVWTGLQVCGFVLEKCQHYIELDGSIRKLVLVMVLVCEVMSRALEALEQQQQQQQPPAARPAGQEPRAHDSAQQEQANHMQLGLALKAVLESVEYKEFLESESGTVHVACLVEVG